MIIKPTKKDLIKSVICMVIGILGLLIFFNLKTSTDGLVAIVVLMIFVSMALTGAGFLGSIISLIFILFKSKND